MELYVASVIRGITGSWAEGQTGQQGRTVPADGDLSIRAGPNTHSHLVSADVWCETVGSRLVNMTEPDAFVFPSN